jgi:phage repressor protein C with HTH and peptisase S24 domain
MQDIAHTPEEIGQKIKAAREEVGLNQREAAAKSGLTYRTYGAYERAEIENPTLEKVQDIARTLSIPELIPGQGDGRQGKPPEMKERADDAEAYVKAQTAHVPLVSVRIAGGDGELPFAREVDSYLSFNKSQIRRETGVNPRRLVALPVVGNSMKPTLAAGDKAVVAKNGHEPIQHGAVYVFYREDRGLMVKRVHWQGDDSLLLRSDNREEPVDFEIDFSDEHSWNVIGRVVKVIKSI